MAASPAVRRYFAERILARTTREGPPPNFRPLDGPPSGRAALDACRQPGRNTLEVQVVTAGGRLRDVRVSCGLCNPATYTAADIAADWARGRGVDEVLSIDPLDRAHLEPLWELLDGSGRPDDAREKLQYALVALQRATRDALGEEQLPLPEIEPPSEDGD